MVERFDADEITIEALLTEAGVRYAVPRYQRSYSWKTEQLKELWEDLIDEEEGHFLGTVVLNKEFFAKTKRKDIIDGQQRLLTLTMFFAVIRDQYLALKAQDRARDVQDFYISSKDDDGNRECKILPGKHLETFFKTYVSEDAKQMSEAKPKTDEERRVYANYQKLADFVKNHLKDLASQKEKLTALKHLRDKLKSLELVLIQVKREEDAFTFFQTLNARGMDLAPADMLKNLLFRKVDSDRSEHIVEAQWGAMIGHLTRGEEQVKVTQFLRQYWISKYDKISEKKLYSAIKQEMEDDGDYEKFLKELVQEAALYRKVVFPMREDWDDAHYPIYRALTNLQVSRGIKQPHSFLLSLLRVMNRNDYEKKLKNKRVIAAFEWVEHFTFVFNLVGRGSPSELDNLYAEVAQDLNKVRSKSDLESKLNKFLEKLKAILKKQLPSKDVFKAFFLENIRYSEKSADVITYVFEKMNSQDGSTSFDVVDVEHIYPQNPDKEWKIRPEEMKDHLHLLGNLTPFGRGDNKKAANMIIKKKVPYYLQSSITMTKDLGREFKKNPAWDQKKIIQRGDELAELAWKIWQLK